jgi:ribosomal protein S18 acetylase RimI-like enzyme
VAQLTPQTTPRTPFVLERLDVVPRGTSPTLPEADVAAMIALEVATQDRPVGPAALLREAQEDGVVALARDVYPPRPVVGFASARQLHDEVHVIRLAVDGAHRRRGIARSLLGELLAWADGTDAVAVVLEVRAGNDAARALYAASGFVADGVRPRYYPDGEDALLLRRERPARGTDRPARPAGGS